MIVKKLIAVLAAAALLATAAAPSAFAGYRYKNHGYYGHGGYSYSYRPYYRYGYGHGYGHGYGYGYYGHGHGDAAVVVGVLAGAVVLGALLSQPRPVYAYAPAVPRSPSGAALGNCVQTLGTGTWNGRPARFAGTRCTDAAGQAYVVNDSVRFLMYLN